MRDLLLFVVAGLTTGSIYGLTATGLTLTYKTSGILNFAHGAVAVVAVDAYLYLAVNRGWPWEAASAVAVLLVGPAMGLLLERLARSLVSAAPALRVVATVGMSVAVTGGAGLIGRHLFGNRPHFRPPPLPGDTVRIGGVFIGKDELIVFAIALVAVSALYVFLRRSRTGVALRAVVDDPDLTDLVGRDPWVLRRLAWVLGTVFASLSGVLLVLAPTLGGGAGGIGRLVLPAFGACALARFRSLPGSFLGGLAIGVGSSVLVPHLTDGWLGRVPSTLPVIVLLVALMATPKRALAEGWTVHRRAVMAAPRVPLRVMFGVGAVVVVALMVAPTWSGLNIAMWTTWLIFGVLFASLGLLVRTSGQVSLCHLGLAAVGASTFAHLAEHGLPWLLALLGAAVVTAAVGAVVALTAIRLAGVFLALATLAFGSILQVFFYPSNLMFGLRINLPAPRPSFAESAVGFHELVVVVLVLSVAGVVAIGRSRLGRLLRGMGDAPVALETQGARVAVTKLVVFAISAGMAGVAGALFSSLYTIASPGQYGPEGSLTMVAILFVVPFGEPLAGIAAAAAFYLLPRLPIANIGSWTNLLFGIAAVVVATYVAGRRAAMRRHSEAAVGEAPTAVAVATGRTRRTGGPGLVVDEVSVRFGGIVALDAVTLRAPAGQITGLIGPNGAGKTTLFNVTTGLVRPSGGRVAYGNRVLSPRLGTAGRARLGIGRTFQQPQLFESMTVAEMLDLGHEAGLAGGGLRAQVLPKPGDRRAIRQAVADAVALTGIDGLLDVPGSQLSTGEKRLVELARCLTGPFDLFLLDEPSAGLDRTETARMMAVLRRAVDEWGVGVLLVEHDMAVVMELCDQVYVLDFGRVIFDGTPDEVRSSEVVRAAYLGTEALAPS